MMSFVENDQQLMAKVKEVESPVAKLALLASSALEGEAAMREATGMERAEVALRVAATYSVMATETDNTGAADNTVLWAGKCVDVARHLDAAIAYYIPRSAALCMSVLDELGGDMRDPAIDTVQGWLQGYGAALERLAELTAQADRFALVALAADGTEGAGDLASEARARAVAGYRSVGDFDTAAALSE